MASNTSENDSKASPIKTSSTSPLGIRSPGPAAATISPPGQKKPRQNSASSSGRPSVEASSAQKAAQPFSQTPSTPSRTGRGTMTGASASIHARASGGNNNVASPSTPNRRQSNTSIGKQSNSPPSSNSTLNPNAGGFLPGGLGSLAEVRDEVLISELLSTSFYSISKTFLTEPFAQLPSQATLTLTIRARLLLQRCLPAICLPIHRPGAMRSKMAATQQIRSHNSLHRCNRCS